MLIAPTIAATAPEPRKSAPADRCIAAGGGFLRARLSGSIKLDLAWGNDGTSCAGSLRPQANGIRLQFSHKQALGDNGLVLVFGIPGVKEGQTARTVPVNVTVIREGTGEFYGTQGDGKCTLDELRQEPLAGVPLKTRAYRVVGRGFCMQPARAVSGQGSVLITRFDFAGRMDIAGEQLAAPVSASGRE